MLFYIYRALIDPVLRDIRKYTPEFSGMKPGDKVLDVCCGTGVQVIEYGRRGLIATGIDIYHGMVKAATKYKMRHNLPDVFFHLADATRLPYPDGYFDYVTVSLGLHDKEKATRDEIISEMKRVVKQDGVLIFIDFNAPLPESIVALFARIIEFLVGGSHYRGFKDYLRNDGLEKILKMHNLCEERRTYLKSGLLVIVKARK